MIRVVIVDDHHLVRAGLQELVGGFDGCSVVAACSGGGDAVEACADTRPDVVLMDLEMPGGLDGIGATRAIVARQPDTAVIILTAFSSPEGVLEALDAGAVGYVLKDAEPAALERAVLSAARGESPIDPRAARALIRARTALPAAPAPAAVAGDGSLSARERQVLRLLARGLANKQIAHALDISEKTVKAHLTSVFRRLDVSGRTQAALWAERNGLLDD